MTLSQSTLDVAQWLLDTSLHALDDCDRDPISRAYVAAGEIAWDDCCGMLVVAPERVYRSQVFPSESTDEELCFGGYIAVEYVVLLVRCVPTVDDRGRAPSAADLQAAYDSLLGDAAVVFNALTSPLPEYLVRSTVAQSFTGAQGGCIGVESRLVIGFEQDRFAICCTEPVPHEPGDAVCKIKANRVVFDPCEGLTATNVQDAICELAASLPVFGEVTEFQVTGGTIGGTQPTFDGAPMFYGNYLRIGDQVTFDIQVDFDNITSFGTGQYFVELPFPSRFNIMLRGACIHDFSQNRQYGLGGHVAAGQVMCPLFYVAPNSQDQPFTHQQPFQLDTDDNFHVQGTYIAEPLP